MVSCTRCVAHGLQCDNFSTCKQCASAIKLCKRAMCKRFDAGSCINGACRYAHEGDKFDKLVPFTRIKFEPSTVKRFRQEARRVTKETPKVKEKGDPAVRSYVALFDEIAKRGKTGGGGGDDDDVAGL